MCIWYFIYSVEATLRTNDVSTAHLIAYHPERDLLPLVLASRHYAVASGDVTRTEYDFVALQRSIEERFIRGRPRLRANVRVVRVKRERNLVDFFTFQVQTVVFCEDFTNAEVFEQLETRIPQDVMSQSLCEDIVKYLLHITDVIQALTLLDVTIAYLVSVHENGDMFLAEYLKRNLRMTRKFPSEIVRHPTTTVYVPAYLSNATYKFKRFHTFFYWSF